MHQRMKEAHEITRLVRKPGTDYVATYTLVWKLDPPTWHQLLRTARRQRRPEFKTARARRVEERTKHRWNGARADARRARHR